MPAARILIVEDNIVEAEALAAMVSTLGHSVCGRATTFDEAVMLGRTQRPDLVLMDVQLRGSQDGADAALVIQTTLQTPVIFITGSQDRSTTSRLGFERAAAVIFKPFRFNQLGDEVTRALARRR